MNRPLETVELRPFPYPYRAALAICSDLDETPDADLYVDTLRFLNTRSDTRFGTGLGLEVANSIYFDMPRDQFSYWNTDDRGRAWVQALIRSGHIDCLHSFGDLATTRAHAQRALEELDRNRCPLQVWIDHAVAPSNFGADRMRGHGDVPTAAVFHADLTWDFGIRYVWRGRVTSVTGQGVRRRLRGIFNPRHAAASARTLAKEAAKGVVGTRPANRYALHRTNAVLHAATLRSGQPVYEFLRANPHWGGVNRGETAGGIGEVLTAPMLARLQAREGSCILYTHLGKMATPRQPFTPGGIAALRRLAAEHHEGRMLVTTTRRLLGLTLAKETVRWTARREDGVLTLDLRTSDPVTPADLEGLTFYVPKPDATRVIVDGVLRDDLDRNAPDRSGRPSVSLRRHALAFPSDSL